MRISRRQLGFAALASLLAVSPLVSRNARAQNPGESSGAARVPTFSEDIAPIVYRSCAPCHHPGGGGPFPLLSYSEVRSHASQIAAVTRSRYMPPWAPEDGFGHFSGERRLSRDEIRTIADWVTAGAPEGDRANAPGPPTFPESWQLGKPDMVLVAPHPLVVPASGEDLFWNFVFAPELTRERYVRAIEIRPGNTAIVHHANLQVDRIGSVRKLEKTPGFGFGGMDVTVSRSPFDPESHFLFWKPGSLPEAEPDGLSWKLDPGNLLVLNTHLQPSGKEETVQPTIGLYFTDKPPQRFPILVELQNDDALQIPAKSGDFVVTDQLRMPIDVDVLGIYPHAHYLGKLLQAYAELPDHSRKWLIRIPDWDLNWQAVYRYSEPVLLPAGSIVHMEFHYDNSERNPRNPHVPPRMVVAGNNADDEMGHLWLQLLPRGRGDGRRAIQQAEAEHRIERNPHDVTALVNLGAIQLSRLHPQDAVATLARAVGLDKSRPEAHDMLGMALQSIGRSQEAVQEFKLALVADPQYLNARYNLARSYAKQQQFAAAAACFQPIAAAFPAVSSVQQQYSDLLTQAGRTAEVSPVPKGSTSSPNTP